MRNQQLLFGIIPLPVNQELEAMSSSPDIQDLPDGVGWTTIIHKGGKRRLRLRDQIRDWLSQRHVKIRVQLEG